MTISKPSEGTSSAYLFLDVATAGRHRPPLVPDAQRRHRRGGGDDRHDLDARSARRSRRRRKRRRPKLGATLSPDLDVVKKSKGPVMTVLDEFYKVGPGPSSSHTIGPMRITYDFYQRCTKLPADQLAKATGLKVHLFGSLSATGKGHGTERASLAGLIGKEPATVDPLFLDEMIVKPEQTYPVKLGDKTFNLSLADIIYDAPKGDFPHPNTMTCKLMAGDKAVYELEYYSAGGGFYRVEGLHAAQEGPAEVSLRDDEGTAPARGEEQALDRAGHHGERDRRVRQDRGADQRVPRQDRRRDAGDREVGPRREGRRPARPDQAALEGGDRLRAGQDDKYESDRAIALVSACALAASEENARGHLVITAPTGGSAGVMPAIVYALIESKRKLPQEKVREGLLAGAAIGYLCKHNATLSGAEGGCQSEIGVASAMSAAFIAQVMDSSPLVHRERRRVGARAPPGHDLRPGRGLRAGALHRALRLRRGEGLDRLHDRDQRDRVAAPRRSRHDDQDPGPDRPGHEHEVQGNERGRPGRQPCPLLT